MMPLHACVNEKAREEESAEVSIGRLDVLYVDGALLCLHLHLSLHGFTALVHVLLRTKKNRDLNHDPRVPRRITRRYPKHRVHQAREDEGRQHDEGESKRKREV